MTVLIRLTAAALAGVCLLVPMAISGVPAAGSAPAPAAAGERPPDIIVVMTDDQRVGTERAMENVSEYFSRGGVRYPQAQVPTNLCCPARAAFLTGEYAHTSGVWENSGPRGAYRAFAPNEAATLPVALSTAGYRTGLFGKYMNHFNKSTEPAYVPPGWDAFHVPSPEDRDGGYNTPIRGLPPGYTTDVFGQGVTDFIRASDPDEPLFVLYAPFAPHHPYDPGPYAGQLTERERLAHERFGRFRNPAFNEKDVSDKPAWVQATKKMKKRAMVKVVRSQAESLLGVDANFQRIMAAQAEVRDPDNTMVVFLSDNGYAWGEHRLALKRHPYSLANRIPLWVRYPSSIPVQPGADQSLVNNLDVTATILDVAGARLSTEGISMLSGTKRSELLLEAAPSRAGLQKAPGFCGLRTAKYLFVEYTSGELELYNYAKDPFELVNVARRPAYGSVVQRFRQVIAGSGCDLDEVRAMPGARLDASGD